MSKPKPWRYYEQQGYELKHSPAGWWVDGACGFLVSGYYKSKRQAIDTAKRTIEEAKRKNESHTWRF